MSAGAHARTHGFLFADLRGYTEFIETHGDREAAELLAVFRPLVRAILAGHEGTEAQAEGAEARTQGDSFYLVFPSVGAAVLCGLDIVRVAGEATEANPGLPIRVGVGVHAGETVETAEGLVGSAVNIAARVCSVARAGEVLVTETVRSLIRTSLDVSFEARGSPHLKGVAEPIALFAVRPGAAYPASTSAPARNPYKGLRPFGEQDQADFFGRDQLSARLVDRLGQVARAGRLLTVVGPSGSGKSSVVRAGLIPALRAGGLAGSAAWRIAVMLPGARPFEELAAALGSVASEPPAGLAEELDRTGDIGGAVARVLPGDDSRLLLVVDQFEELFTVTRDGAVRERFLEALSRALAGARGRLLAVITMRADFLDRPLLVPEFGELVREGLEAVTPLTPNELEEAIARPAAAVGLELEPGLASEVIADVARQPGALPQLQYALTELFERSDGHRLSRGTYAAIGGVLGALGRRAEETYGALEPDARGLARQAFLRLVVPGEGAGATARRLPTTELTSPADDPARLGEVLDAFGHWRLLSFDRDAVSGEPTVEIAHEALLTRWPRLAGWVEQDRADLWMRRRLEDAAGEWSRSGRDAGFLLAGSRLDLFEGWAASTELALTALEHAFLEASVAERRRAADEARAREAHERALERRAATRLRALVALFATAAVLAVGLVVVVTGQAQGAREQAAVADARELAAASSANLGVDPSLSLLLAVESARATADRGYVTEETMDALHWALQAAAVTYPAGDGSFAVRAGPDGPRGIPLLPPAELVTLASEHAGRALTDEECRRYLHVDACPTAGDAGIAPGDLQVRSGSGVVPVSALAGPDLNGTQVRVASDLPADLASLLPELTQEGIGVAVASGTAGLGSLPAGELPDLALVSRPHDVAALARQGRLIDLGAFVDAGRLRADLGGYLVSLGTLDAEGTWPAGSGTLYGAPVAASLGGLVWYPKAAFEKAGYAIPTSWDGLVALSRRMVADGRTPWCLGVEAGPESGAAAADWVESLVLGGSGPAVYEDWAVGGLGQETGSAVLFSDFRVRSAFERFGEIALGDGFVLGGPGSIGLIPARLAAWPEVSEWPEVSDRDPPSCWLTHGGGADRQGWPAQLSREAGWFALPAVDPAHAGAARGTTYTVVVFHDRPEVRKLVEQLLGAAFAARLAGAPAATGLLPVRAVDPSAFRDAIDGAQASLLRSALRTGAFRSDASGAHVAAGRLGVLDRDADLPGPGRREPRRRARRPRGGRVRNRAGRWGGHAAGGRDLRRQHVHVPGTGGRPPGLQPDGRLLGRPRRRRRHADLRAGVGLLHVGRGDQGRGQSCRERPHMAAPSGPPGRPSPCTRGRTHRARLPAGDLGARDVHVRPGGPVAWRTATSWSARPTTRSTRLPRP